MFGSSHFDRAIRALTDHSKRMPWSWRPKRSYRFAHNAVMSLLLFLIAFLFMGIPVFASSGGPPVARHVVVTHRNVVKGGSGINPIKHISYNLAGGSGITPVKRSPSGGSGINPVRRTPQGASGILPVK